ncbi:deoxyribodipyrimidine photo-lyase [Catenovulum maritimum]|uniref:Deoxyribodipyrimidine photo-lyase n=1 Tax=Catenovulum maritimum TaxID=1513271 RepID=A0A0J8JIA3_9ALTE|nr:deoxyribodipyrimidine photo-lyase [Catenovulum maritimum]KMT64186.1 hypothetical protein XM47_15570 [Catenovulum maritimum]
MQLVWFRNDLRTYDHTGLALAKQSGEPIIAVYIATPQQWKQHKMASIKTQLIYSRVDSLSQDLAKLNIPLIIKVVDTYSDCIYVMNELIEKFPIKSIHVSAEYELNEINRDECVEQMCQKHQVKFHQHHDSVILPPGSVVKNDASPYCVFSAFRKKWLNVFLNKPVTCLQQIKPQAKIELNFDLNTRDLITAEHDLTQWPTQQDVVLNKLRVFCSSNVSQYKNNRDFPEVDGTSKLSPYLSIGIISPRQAVNRMMAEHGDQVFNFDTNEGTWVSELIWREFYRHLCFFYPEISKRKSVKTKFESIKWRNQVEEFSSWKQGVTGYPIVDAAMRQLNQTGWMHNRLRMITASFLVKDLQVDWRWGEDYFMSKLIDGDYAANNGGWQWCASTGHDSAPYFRIFNPTTQGQKFDPDGRFIKRYCPELGSIPDKHIHTPWQYCDKLGCNINYPRPIVDHKQAREITLSLYKE